MRRLLTTIVAALSINPAACGDDSKSHHVSQQDAVPDITKYDADGSDVNDVTSYDLGCEDKVWFQDKDDDGYGDKQMNVHGCQPPNDGKYVTNFLDCDDTDPKINPDGKEVCNGKDDDCKNGIDEGLPEPKMKACAYDPKNNSNPFCTEYKFEVCGGALGMVETPCAIYSSAAETCDGFDNNCDGKIDEDLTQPCYGECGEGLEACVNGKWANCSAPLPKPEICDGFDNDCDGITDSIIEQVATKCEKYNFIFLIDNSNSMYINNDPSGLRFYGMHNVVDNAWQDDKGLISVFAGYYAAVGSFTSDKAVLNANIDEAKYVDVGSGTDIGGAVNTAIDSFPDYAQNNVVILLTDGEDNGFVSPSMVNQYAIEKGVEICAYRLGDVSDTYLSTMVADTGGVEKVYSAADLSQKFLEAYMIFKCAEVHECVDGVMVKKTSGCLKQ